MHSTRTLLLTQGYEPIQIISWQRAITLMALDKVDVVEQYDEEIHAVSMVMQVPAVVRLRKSFPRRTKPVKFSRVNIYARDGHRCQYCGVTCTTSDLTYDHVIPRCARRCASTKGEHRVCLLRVQPREGKPHAVGSSHEAAVDAGAPDVDASVQIRVSAQSVPDAWRDYVYWTSEIDNPDGGAD